MAAKGRTRSAGGQDLTQALEDYASASRQPLTMLLFVAPLIVLYEFGTLYLNSDWAALTETRVVAFSLIRQFMRLFGLPSRWMPGLAIMTVLLTWHIARRERWRLQVGTALLMGVEASLLIFPLLAWGRIQGYLLPLYAGEPATWESSLVLAIGAGVYEEAIFRLFAFTMLDLILIDLLRIPRRPAYVVIVAGTSVLFAAYHYWSPAAATFAWSDFIFRSVSGVYFGMLFLWRGFGITAGAHAAYDIYYFMGPWLARG